MNDLSIICQTHGMDYAVDCSECSEKEQLFCKQVERAHKQLTCRHQSENLGESDFEFFVCIKCGLKDAGIEYHVLPDIKTLPN